MNKKITVLGGGSWGATLASHLSRKGHQIKMWEFFEEIARQLDSSRTSKVLPQLKIPEAMFITSNLKAALIPEPEVILCVVPSHGVRSTMESIVKEGLAPKSALIVNASKGIEQNTCLRMTEVITKILPGTKERVAVLSGPSHAEEVAMNLPTAVDIASTSEALTSTLAEVFGGERFRVYPSPDPIGVELGGALKNIYAIGCGVVDGLKLGDNAKAAMMTRALNEMARLGKTLGARVETFFGLSGVGDLIVTCLSQHSRNRLLGEKIGLGKTLKQALSEMTMVAEGVKTTESAHQLVEAKKVDAPIIQEIYQILYKGKNPKDSVHDLLQRAVHPEMADLFK